MTNEPNPIPKKVVVRKVIKKVVRKSSDQPTIISNSEKSTMSSTATTPLKKNSEIKNIPTKKLPLPKPKAENIAKPIEKKRKFPMIFMLAIGVGVILVGTAIYLMSHSNKTDKNVDDKNIFQKTTTPSSNAALILPIAARLPAGAPLWVHLVNSAGDAEALKNGPAKALNAYKELKAASPFVILTPTPPKEGWLAEGKIKLVAKEVQTVLKDQKCDASRLVISGEGVGTTAALLLAAELDGAVGAVLGIGAPSEESFQEIARFRYVPLRFLVPAADKEAVGWAQKIAGDLRASGCAVTVTEISPSPSLIGGAWGAPEIWAWMVTRRVPDANTRAGIDALLAWSAPKPPAGQSMTAKPTKVDETQLVKGGLLGEYFDGVAFNSKLLERIDKKIAIPDRAYQLPNGKADNLSVKWSGYVHIENEGLYTFFSRSDDGQRLTIGGVGVIVDWVDHGETEVSGVIKLGVGWYDITIEHYQGGGGGSIAAFWQGPKFERKAIEGDSFAVLKTKIPGGKQ
jgi:hypothetical protein